MEYGKLVNDALQYTRHSQAVWAYLGFSVLAAFLLFTLGALAFVLGALNPATILFNPASLGILLFFGLLWLSFVVVGGLAVYGTVIKNAVDGNTLSQSWQAFKPQLGSLVGAVLFAIFVNVLFAVPINLAGMALPSLKGLFGTLGFLAFLVLGLAFLFVEYAVVLSGLSAWQSVKKSVDVFLKDPIDVLLVMLVSSLIAAGILLAGALFLLVLGLLVLAVVGFNASALGILLVPLVLAAILIILIIVFASEVVQLHILAHAYRELGTPASSTPAKPASPPTKKVVAPKTQTPVRKAKIKSKVKRT